MDAFIIADLGVLALAKKYAPQVERHVSTQAGITNYEAAKVCYELGAKRVVLARELPLTEIAQIRDNCPQDLELEAFVHGAMCMSVSGRCLLSNYMAGRDANRGQCAQPCADECAAAGLAALVHKAGDAHKQRTHDEIEQFTHRSSAGAGSLMRFLIRHTAIPDTGP